MSAITMSSICNCIAASKIPLPFLPLSSLIRTPPPRFPSLKTNAKRNRFPSQTAADRAVVRPLDGFVTHKKDDDGQLDWEDQILEETAPLVAFVRMILYPGRYESGDKLNADHEKTILESLLPYHPGFKRKRGCGIDYITVGYHPDFESSRCLFIVRKDGELVDFSYWKCIKGLIRKKYPRYADSFIFKHFRQRD